MKQYQLPILSNQQVSTRYWHMEVDTSMLDVAINPGQFFNIRCADRFSPFLRRPLSVYRINPSSIEFLYLVKGKGTSAMTMLQAGDRLDILGPLGKGFEAPKENQSILLVARGVGIATLAAVAQKAYDHNNQCVAVLSARTKEDLLAAAYLQEFGATIYQVTEEMGTSAVEDVHTLIEEQILSTYRIDKIYTCGSERLAKMSQHIASTYQIPGEIALEEHMGCAMGACYACVCDIKESEQVKSVRVCVDGPVFPLDQVVFS